MPSIFRRDTGAGHTMSPTRPAEASGIAPPTRAEFARLDSSRKNETSAAEVTHPHDRDGRDTKIFGMGGPMSPTRPGMRGDLQTGTFLIPTVHRVDARDTKWMVETLLRRRQEDNEKIPFISERRPGKRSTGAPLLWRPTVLTVSLAGLLARSTRPASHDRTPAFVAGGDDDLLVKTIDVTPVHELAVRIPITQQPRSTGMTK